jgi:hypothetical protein
MEERVERSCKSHTVESADSLERYRPIIYSLHFYTLNLKHEFLPFLKANMLYFELLATLVGRQDCKKMKTP